MTDSNLNSNASNHSSCSALDLSWLSESVMEAALNTKNLSLTDIHHFQSSLKAAEGWGMDMDASERVRVKIDIKEATLLSKMVKTEFAQVAKRLHIYRLMKIHKTWEQVHFMAGMHGQGAYILMKDFTGLQPDNVSLSLTAFHDALRQNGSKIPWTDDIEETARPKVQKQVAAKLCRAYRRLVQSLSDQELGGYAPGFLQETLLYRVEDLMVLWGVTEEEVNLKPQEDRKDDDEDEGEEGTFHGEDDDYEDGPAGRY